MREKFDDGFADGIQVSVDRNVNPSLHAAEILDFSIRQSQTDACLGSFVKAYSLSAILGSSFMKKKSLLSSVSVLVILGVSAMCFAQKYAAPSDGWAYTFEGANAEDSPDPFSALDGTWDHNNGSDQWDGTGIGDGNPGGVSALTEGGTTFVRVQDPGDPSDYGFDDPGSNRKVYLTHNLIDDLTEDPGNLNSIVDDGVTLYFRTRVATAATGPIDDWHPDGGGGIEDWPEDGRGYFQHDSGKSLIAIKQTDGANVAFGLDYADAAFHPDLAPDDSPQGLILQNLLFGDTLAGDGGIFGLTDNSQDSDPDNFNFDFTANELGQMVAVDDITSWQEFWITIEAGNIATNPDFPDDLDGTHKVTVYSGTAGDPLVAEEFFVTAAQGSDYVDDEEESYIAFGGGATPQAGAFDLDFLSWAPGVHVPTLADVGGDCNPNTGGDLDGNGKVEFADFLVLSGNFGSEVDSHAQGDIDCNGKVEFADFLALSGNFGNDVAGAESVPEPSSSLLLVFGAIAALACRKTKS